MGRAALELIGQGAFGHSFDPLVEDGTNAFASAIKDFVYACCLVLFCRDLTTYFSPTIQSLMIYLALIIPFSPLIDACERRPALSAFVGRCFDYLPHTGLRRLKAIVDVLTSTSRSIYAEKQAALESDDKETKMRVLEGRDLMSVLRTCDLYVQTSS